MTDTSSDTMVYAEITEGAPEPLELGAAQGNNVAESSDLAARPTGSLEEAKNEVLREFREKLESLGLSIEEALPRGRAPSPAQQQITALSHKTPSSSIVVPATGPGRVLPSTDGSCGCGASGPTTLVYAIGKLGVDYGTQARRDSFIQFMPLDRNNPDVPDQLLAYLNDRPYEAKSLIWTLNLDATPIYSILPVGAFVDEVYGRLREFLDDQFNQRSELVSVPGYISGSVTLYSGQTVPLVIPEVRGLFNWSVASQVERALGPREEPAAEEPAAEEPGAGAEPPDRDVRQGRLEGFINRVYYELRNLGLSGPDRALNYSATNLFQILAAIDSARTAGRNEFRSFIVQKSPVCRPDSECYDVKIRFMNPSNILNSSFVVYFTIDVSDVMPVTIGVPRQWFEG